MKIAIIGTRGIPNHYGGFEQCAEYLALGLKKTGFDVLVYNSHNHPYQKDEWNGVRIKHCYDPEYKLGTAGQFIYDLNCIIDLYKQKVDIVLQLGYTSSSVWGWLLPSKSVVTTNMDGLEWKRTKYSERVKKFLQYAEKLGIKYSDHLIADSKGIQDYLMNKYNANSVYIPYGANVFENADVKVLTEFALVPHEYDLLIARLEPENSIEIILEGVAITEEKRTFLVIGKHETTYGEYLKNKFKNVPNIRFIGAIYDINKLNNIRYYSNMYFHGHTVGGTNPSLLEAMASNSLICAHDNDFNKYILEEDALYFLSKEDVSKHLKASKADIQNQTMLSNNKKKINEVYTWDYIVKLYADHLNSVAGVFNRNK